MNEDGHQCVDCGDTIYTPRPRNSGEIAGMRETLIRKAVIILREIRGKF